jgi:hypothetical protein
MSNASDLDQSDEQPSDEELDEWARATEKVMADCANSQPWEGGPIWMNGHGPLRDALEIADVPEEYFGRSQTEFGVRVVEDASLGMVHQRSQRRSRNFPGGYGRSRHRS